MPNKLDRRRNYVDDLTYLARRIAGIVRFRSKAGRGVRVSPELWNMLGCSERQGWRALNRLPGCITRTRIYDFEGARWMTILTYNTETRPGEIHQSIMRDAVRYAAPLIELVRCALTKNYCGPDPVAACPDATCATAAAGLIRISLPLLRALDAPAGPKPDAPRMGGIWTTTACGRDRVAGIRARRLLAGAASMRHGIRATLELARGCLETLLSNKPECQCLDVVGFILKDKTKMGTPDGGGRMNLPSPASGAACGGPAGRTASERKHVRSARSRRRSAWALTSRLLGRVSGSEHWSRPLLAHWLARNLTASNEGQLMRALEAGLVWAWGGYKFAKEQKAKPKPPNTLAALAHAERLLGLR